MCPHPPPALGGQPASGDGGGEVLVGKEEEHCGG